MKRTKSLGFCNPKQISGAGMYSANWGHSVWDVGLHKALFLVHLIVPAMFLTEMHSPEPALALA